MKFTLTTITKKGSTTTKYITNKNKVICLK
jgi:hypothetical protein